MKNYEISIWEDRHDGNLLKEKKIATIGSDSMASESRAFNPQLTRNINGTHTFTFKMYYVCNDFALEGMSKGFKKYTNPFISLMSNERKIKLKYNNIWYDFVIKNCQEDSNDKSITYTCKDLFINELGKTGFSLEFDNELLNNSGTISELTKKILEGTDWQIAPNQDTILQEHNEPVYESANVPNEFTATKDGDISNSNGTPIIQGSKILLFQSCVPTHSDSIDLTGEVIGATDTCQFLYNGTNYWQTEPNQMLVINASSYSISGGKWYKESKTIEEVTIDYFVFKIDINGEETEIINIPYVNSVSSQYRGMRLVKSQKTAIDKVLNRSVNIYKDNNDDSKIYYEYATTEFTKPTTVNNLFINYENFLGTDGWLSNGEIRTQIYPLIRSWSGQGDFDTTSYLYIPSNSVNLNLGLQESYMNFPEGFIEGEKYIFRFKIKSNSNDNYPGSYITGNHTITPNIASYLAASISPSIKTSYFTFDQEIEETLDHWFEYTAICNKSISKRDIVTTFTETSGGVEVSCKLGLFLSNGATPYWLEKVEFYRYVEGLYGSENTPIRIDPGSLGTKSIGQIVYKYYNPTQSYTKEDEIKYAYSAPEKWNQVTPVYRSNPFEEVRSIKAKNSNRFNLLQALAETFDCWCDFIIDHNVDGSIKFVNNKAQKFIKFKREIGQNNGLCFTYGLDLKSISRTIASEQIATKTIVPINSNSYGEDGFCSIGRCIENYPRVNYILNFDYYISHGMIDSNTLNNDLYSPTNDAIGYYYKLHNWNIQYDTESELKIKRQSELTEQAAYQKTYSEAMEASQQEATNLLNELFAFCSVTTMAQVKDYAVQYSDSSELQAKLNAYYAAKKAYENYSSIYQELSLNIGVLQNEIDALSTSLNTIKNNIINLDKQFYSKYSRFIQEGSWTSEDYYDDLQYYLDAVNVAFTSSKPQISYNINVMRLSEIEGFKNRKFELGDICYIQDTEFFGYVAGDPLTPYREKVLISEVTENLEDPTQSTFKVQNYKTQFEDLFQRITATTQSLQYSEGEYGRAASIVSSNNTIEADVLQNSILTNENLVIQAQNESIYQDNTGITLADTTNPNYKLKITSKGIFVNSGEGWHNAIRGDGITADALSAGSINTNKIIISDGTFTAFRWDNTGINAYQQLYTEEDIPQKSGINLATFIRFDHFGLYGIKNYTDSSTQQSIFAPTDEDDIWTNADFGLTWKGFFLKNKKGGGLFEISNENDLVVKDGTASQKERIKIGRISGDGNQSPYVYGIRISDASGASVMETSDDGELWLKKILHISNTSGSGYNVQIGYLNGVKALGSSIHQVFNANNKFFVYEDGSIKATDGEFTGKIEATSGKIGNLIINNDKTIPGLSKIEIFSNLGYNFDVSGGSANPQTITLEARLIGFPSTGNTVTWKRKDTNSENNWIDITTGSQCSITYSNFESWQSNNCCYIKAICTNVDLLSSYEDIVTLYKINDGSVDNCRISTDNEEILKYYNTSSGNVSLNFIPTYLNFHFLLEENEIYPTPNVNTDSTDNIFDLYYISINNDIKNITHIATRETLSSNYYLNVSDIFNNYLHCTDNSEYNDTIEDDLNLYVQCTSESVYNSNIYYYKLEGGLYVRYEPTEADFNQNKTSYYIYNEGNSIIYSILEQGQYIDCNPQPTRKQFNSNKGNYYVHIVIDPTLYGNLFIDWIYNGNHIIKTITSDFSTDANLAKLAINAADITASIQSTKVQFNSDGLTIANGGFKIQNNLGNNVLEANDSGDLILSNITAINGHFSGEVNADSGSFKGTVFAENGEFRGSVYATDGEFRGSVYANNGEFHGSVYANNGEFSGKITATSGTISGFTIENNNLHTQSNEIILSSNSKQIKVGSITLDGSNSIISAGENDNLSFVINPEKAIFNNIIAKGKISTSIFENSSVQAVGGSMIFKPTFKIESYDITNKTLVLDENFTGDIGDYIYLVNSSGKFVGDINSINSKNGKTIVLNDPLIQNSEYYFLIDIGKTDDLLIGINATNTSNSFINQQSITFSKLSGKSSDDEHLYTHCTIESVYSSEFIYYELENNYIQCTNQSIFNLRKLYFIYNTEENIYTPVENLKQVDFNNNKTNYWTNNFIMSTPQPNESEFNLNKTKYYIGKHNVTYSNNLVLGNLESIGLSGFGLYSDNVYLKGSLTTASAANKYAGVNTISNVKFNKGYSDDSAIIFWAGAIDNTDLEIQKSPFQVTEKGTIYASQGVFTGSIISDSIIQGANIYAINLIGGTNDESSALNIYNTSQGIVFKDGFDNPNPTTLFTINSQGFYDSNNNQFISIGQNNIEYTGNKININNIAFNSYNIIENNNNLNIKLLNQNDNIIQLHFVESSSEINLKSNNINFNIERTNLYSSDIYFKDDSMHYKAILQNNNIIGYDLYI